MNGKEQQNLPPLQTQEEQKWESIRPYLLDPREDYPEPYYMLEYNGVPFSALGGIQAISGQKKNGKSFVLTQLMAAVLDDGTGRTAEYLPGLRVPERTVERLGHLSKVLYVDTEMEKLNSAKVLRRVHWLCGWDMKEPNERLSVMWLRTVENDPTTREAAYEKRFRLIRDAIELLSPDIVFIDGVRDIIGDFNDNKESAEIVLRLMAMAEKRGICIWNALHMNPRPGNDDDSKMRGHLGTELGNKVTDTLVSSKKKGADGIYFTVRQIDARNKDVDDWTFRVTDDAGALGIPRITGGDATAETTQAVKADSDTDIIAWLNKAAQDYEWPMSRNDVKRKVFGEIGGVRNNNKKQADLDIAVDMGWLVESTLKKKGRYMLDIDMGNLPF